MAKVKNITDKSVSVNVGEGVMVTVAAKAMGECPDEFCRSLGRSPFDSVVEMVSGGALVPVRDDAPVAAPPAAAPVLPPVPPAPTPMPLAEEEVKPKGKKG